MWLSPQQSSATPSGVLFSAVRVCWCSCGVLRLRMPDWGGSWLPVLDAAAAKDATGADRLWPVWLDTTTPDGGCHQQQNAGSAGG